VTDLNGMVGAVTLQAGSNITLTPQSGNVIEISSTGGGSPFPGSVLMPAAWFEASMLDEFYADNDSVNLWPNLIANGWENLIANTAPVFKTSIVNGQDVVRFNGTNTSMSSVNNRMQALFATREFTVITVCAQDTTSAMAILGKAAGSNYEFRQQVPNTGGSGTFWQSGGATYAAPGNYGSAPTAGTFYVCALRARYDVEVAAWRDGGTKVSSTSFTGSMIVGASSFTVGQRGDSLEWFDGDIAEILFYPRALSLTELDAVSAYLATKYGLTVSAYA
jgi:Concanavalin A-like lectin/glucanases superfamily